MTHLQRSVNSVMQWHEEYMFKRSNIPVSGTTLNVKVKEVIDIEDTIWSPAYGLKVNVR